LILGRHHPQPTHRRNFKFSIVFRVLALGLLLTGILQAAPASGNLERVTLQLKWFHQFQFAGYYAAIEKGFYREEGLEVVLRERNPQVDPVNDVLSGNADYGITDTGLILAAQKGAPVVLLAQIYQHSPLVLMTPRKSKLKRASDLIGRRVTTDSSGITDTPILAMLHQEAGSLEAFELQPYSFRNDDLIEGKTDALAGYRSDQPFYFQQKGFPINIIDPRDYGIDFYGDNLFTTHKELEEHPDRVKRMHRATLRGWRYALEHPQEIIDLILSRYNTQDFDRSHLSYQASETIRLVDNDITKLGSFWPSRYQRIALTYARLGLAESSQIPPTFFYDPDDFLLTSAEREALRELKTLRVPIIEDQAPLSFLDDDLPSGYLNELIAKLASTLGLEIEWHRGLNYPDSLKALESGTVNVLSDYSNPGQTRDYLLETTPVHEAPFVAVGRSDATNVREVDDLKNHRVGVVSGFRQAHLLASRYPYLDLVRFDDLETAYRALRSNDVDYYIDNASHAGYFLHTQLASDLKIAGQLPDHEVDSLELRFAIAKDLPLVHSAMQKILDKRGKEWRNILTERWARQISAYESTRPNPQSALSKQERAWLEKHPVIKVALDPAWAPVEYRNVDGTYEGISLDYLKLLEESLGIQFEVPRLETWEAAMAAVAAREADMFASVSRTAEREKFSTFTAPYIDMPIRIFAHKDSGYIGKLSHLEGRRVAVPRGYAVETWLQQNHPDLLLVGVASPEEGIDLVAKRAVDAFVGNVLTANYYLLKNQVQEVQLAGETPYYNRQSMAVRKDWPIFVNILQKGLNGISENQKQLIYNRWMNVQFERSVDYTLIWQVTLIALLILSGALYWNRRLAREVGQRKSAESKLLQYQDTLEQMVSERTDALRSSESRLNEAQRIAKLGGWELDMQTEMLSWSEEVYRIFELDPTDFVPSLESFLEHVYPQDRGEMLTTFLESIEKRETYSLTHRLLMSDGRIKYVRENAIPYFDAQGNPTRCVGTVQDVTDDVLKEQRLQQAATVFNSTVEGVIITDEDANITDVNEAFTSITGYAREEVIGKTSSILASGRHDREFYQQMWHSLLNAGSWSGEIWNRRRDGMLYPELLTISAVRNEQQRLSGYVGVFTDISRLKEVEQRLEHLAHHDALTGIPNRLLLSDRLEQSIRHASRHNRGFALVFVDLDRFKMINDSLGHQAGDELLKQLADRLVKTVRNEDTVGRISGDEFVLILEDTQTREDATAVANKIMQCFYQPFRIADKDVRVTSSMGLTLYPQDGEEGDVLLRNADAAMYRAKDEGRNTFQFYTSELTEVATEHVFLENALREALHTDQMFLVYQPQVDLDTGMLTGLEALLRWNHPEEGPISPARFIPIAEQSGLIREIGAWVLKQACEQGKAWLEQGLSIGRMGVNVAGPQIQQGGFNRLVIDTLEETGLPTQNLELEVTESFVMRNMDSSIDDLQVLREKGVQVAIDDFGTGYSSLSYLKQLPIDKLKIDKSFVRHIPDDTNDMAIAEAVIALAGALHLNVIAEGVETQEQAEFLSDKGCAQAQGYYFSRPLPAENIEELLRTRFARSA